MNILPGQLVLYDKESNKLMRVGEYGAGTGVAVGIEPPTIELDGLGSKEEVEIAEKVFDELRGPKYVAFDFNSKPSNVSMVEWISKLKNGKLVFVDEE